MRFGGIGFPESAQSKAVFRPFAGAVFTGLLQNESFAAVLSVSKNLF